MNRALLLSCLLFLLIQPLVAQKIKGIVQTEEATPLPFANVYIQNSDKGTYSDENGQFELTGEGVQFILVVSLIGYETQSIAINTRKSAFVTVTLQASEIELEEAVVEGKKENVGKSIMKRVIANKEKVRNYDLAYSADSYYRTSMEKWIKKGKKDTIEIEEGFKPVYLNENFARQHYAGKKSKRIVKAELKQTGDDALKRSARMAVDYDFRGTNLGVTYNPLEYFRNPSDANIDLYDNQLNNPSLSDLPITSPLSDNAFLSYRFKLKDIKAIGEDTTFVVQVQPFFKQAPLFNGELEIKKNGYLLKKADLTINSNALTLANQFAFHITYDSLAGNQWRPTERLFFYEANFGGDLYKVETVVQESDFDFQPEYDKNFFNNEVIVYEVQALERDTSIWTTIRPKELALNIDQQEFLSEQDSIWHYKQSPEYYRIQDSIYNHNGILDFLFEGVGWKRRAKGVTLYFNSLLESVRPLGVGGYRHSLGGTVEKKFLDTGNTLDFDYEVNYGFQNEDWKGELEVGYTYLPSRFSRAYVKVKDMYELVTLNTSLQALLSRNNFVRSKAFGAGHSFEIKNGVYLTTAFEFADKIPINDLTLSEWSNDLFGDNNEPVRFERYRALFLNLELLFKFDQQYITRGREKIVLGTRYPTLKLKYRKGVPDVFQSEVAFDQLELECYHRAKTKIGSSNWNVQAGGFVNQRNLRSIEHRFFRGGTPGFFIDPLRSMQLLSSTLSTPNAYLQGGLMHHFDGFFFDKIPLLNRLQLELLGGGAFLSIPDQSFTHAELFAGIGKKFRLFKEQVQMAIYAVTADNTLENATISYRIGFNFFNAFSGEWSY